MTRYEIESAFRAARNKQELKNIWLRLMKENHPDKGGSLETCQIVNELYDKISRGPASFFRSEESAESAQEQEEEFGSAEEIPEALREKVLRFAGIPGLVLELIGSWLWISGDTRANKDALKSSGFRWSPKKTAWYFHAEPYRKHSRKNFTLDEIRNLHGARKFGQFAKELA